MRLNNENFCTFRFQSQLKKSEICFQNLLANILFISITCQSADYVLTCKSYKVINKFIYVFQKRYLTLHDKCNKLYEHV